MPTHGYPDFTQVVTHILTGGFAGLEELAARLKSIAPWDLRGNIVLMEDFETEETEWVDRSNGGTSAATRSSRHKWSGDWAMKLTADDVENAHASAHRYLYHLPASKYALFSRIAHDPNLQEWRLNLWWTLTAFSTIIGVRHDFATSTISIRTGLETWQDIAIVREPNEDTFIFHPVLLIADLVNLKYDKLYYDGREYDISAYDIYSVDAEHEVYSMVTIRALAVNSTGCTIYVDDIIIAKNVP